jgi:hypothetical protein
MSSFPMSMNPIETVTNNLPPFTLWLYRLLATFPLTGLAGIDHMAIGSQFTGFAKLFINVVTLGSWYFYDIVQVYNTTNLRDKGLKIPFFETGSIGKGRIDDIPSKELKSNEKNWLYLLFTLLFALLYFITTFFLKSSTDMFATGFRYFSGFLLVAAVVLGVFTFFSFATNKTQLLTMPTSGNNQRDALSSLYTTTGLANPAINPLSTNPIFNPTTILRGGSLSELKRAAVHIGGESSKSFQPIYFTTILLLLPITGFLTYNLRKIKDNKRE